MLWVIFFFICGVIMILLEFVLPGGVCGGIGALLVVGVDATGAAEIVFRCPGAKPVETQHICTAHHFQVAPEHGADDCPAAAAEGTVTAAGIDKPVGQGQFQLNGAAMAGGLVYGFDLHDDLAGKCQGGRSG